LTFIVRLFCLFAFQLPRVGPLVNVDGAHGYSSLFITFTMGAYSSGLGGSAVPFIP